MWLPRQVNLHTDISQRTVHQQSPTPANNECIILWAIYSVLHYWGRTQQQPLMHKACDLCLCPQGQQPLFSKDRSRFFCTLPVKQGGQGDFHHVTMFSRKVTLSLLHELSSSLIRNLSVQIFSNPPDWLSFSYEASRMKSDTWRRETGRWRKS